MLVIVLGHRVKRRQQHCLVPRIVAPLAVLLVPTVIIVIITVRAL